MDGRDKPGHDKGGRGILECLRATAPCGRLPLSLSIALLIAPALWNGFPLLQYDTGGYLARWYDGRLHTKPLDASMA